MRVDHRRPTFASGLRLCLFALIATLVAAWSPVAQARAAHRHGAHHHVARHAPQPEARYASIVIDAESGQILSASDPDRPSYPASLTKVMTLYLLFDALDQGRVHMDTLMPVSAHAAGQAPSKLDLRPGERISVEDAIKAIVTKSANDVAVVIAEELGGSESQFAATMTAKARALGMTNTTYRNASGLPNMAQKSTPRDQATLARALIRNHAHYYHFFSTREFAWKDMVIPTHNHLMVNYPGADGIKTGYTNASGFNLISSAVRDGHRLIGVIFGGDTVSWRDQRMAALLDHGFARVEGGTEIAALDDAPPPVPKAEPTEIRKQATAAAPAKALKHRVAMATDDEDDDDEGDSDGNDWAIQVGAFSLARSAHHAAASAAHLLGGLIANASIAVNKGRTSHHQTLYRARLSGFTEDQARAACRKLERSRQSCHVVQPSA